MRYPTLAGLVLALTLTASTPAYAVDDDPAGPDCRGLATSIPEECDATVLAWLGQARNDAAVYHTNLTWTLADLVAERLAHNETRLELGAARLTIEKQRLTIARLRAVIRGLR